MKIFGWAADIAGCGYYRIGLPLRALDEAYDDVQTAASTAMTDMTREKADVVVGQRVCLPGPSGLWQELAGKKPLVFEVDDDLWHVDPGNESAHNFFNSSDVQQRLAENVRAADAVTVTTSHLAEVVSELNSNVYVLPNCISPELLQHERKRSERLTIGWAGSATHLPDFRVAAAQLGRFFRRNPQVDMHFIGVNYGELMGKDDTYFTPWVDDVVAYIKLMDFDIGIAPLASMPFNHSKSYIKALEYASLGIPVVASNVGPYREFVRHGETGFLVKHELDWGKYLYQLTQDEDMRLEMGKQAREYARQFTIDANIARWRNVYDSVL